MILIQFQEDKKITWERHWPRDFVFMMHLNLNSSKQNEIDSYIVGRISSYEYLPVFDQTVLTTYNVSFWTPVILVANLQIQL